MHCCYTTNISLSHSLPYLLFGPFTSFLCSLNFLVSRFRCLALCSHSSYPSSFLQPLLCLLSSITCLFPSHLLFHLSGVSFHFVPDPSLFSLTPPSTFLTPPSTILAPPSSFVTPPSPSWPLPLLAPPPPPDSSPRLRLGRSESLCADRHRSLRGNGARGKQSRSRSDVDLQAATTAVQRPPPSPLPQHHLL